MLRARLKCHTQRAGRPALDTLCLEPANTSSIYYRTVCEYLSVEAEGSVLLNTQPVGLISTGVYPARLLSVFTSIPDTFSFCVSLL